MSDILGQVEWLDFTLHPRLVLDVRGIEVAFQLLGLKDTASEMEVVFKVLCVVQHGDGKLIYNDDDCVIRHQAFAEFARDLKKLLDGDPREATLASVGNGLVLTVKRKNQVPLMQVTMHKWEGSWQPATSASAGRSILRTDVLERWRLEQLGAYCRQLDEWVSANASMNTPDLKIYSLPFQFEDLHSLTDLDPWFARLAGLRANEIAEVLREDWHGIKSAQVAAFRDALLAFTPTSIVYAADGPRDVWRKGWWLRMNLPETDEGWSEVNLHAPPDPDALEMVLDRYDLPEREVVSEFLRSFYKLSNALAGSSSAFYEPPWFRLVESGYYDDVDKPGHFDPHREWADAFLIYNTFDGNWVLMKPNGEIGWYIAPEIRIRPLTPSFSGFLEKCALCYRVGGHLDYYNCEHLLYGE
jgi:hypothetical protein